MLCWVEDTSLYFYQTSEILVAGQVILWWIIKIAFSFCYYGVIKKLYAIKIKLDKLETDHA